MEFTIGSRILHYVTVTADSEEEAQEIAEQYPVDKWEMSDESQIVDIVSCDLTE